MNLLTWPAQNTSFSEKCSRVFLGVFTGRLMRSFSWGSGCLANSATVIDSIDSIQEARTGEYENLFQLI